MIFEELLLTLVCQEFDVTEGEIFDETRESDKQDILAMFVHIGHNNHGKTVKGLYKFMQSRGYPKSRACLYNYLKRAKRLIEWNLTFRVAHNSITASLRQALESPIHKIHEDDTRIAHETFGRLFSKIYLLKQGQNLTALERHLDTYLKSELLAIEVNGEEEV